MKDVGEFEERNKEFDLKFNRNEIIKKSIPSEEPVIFDIGGHYGESIDYFENIFPRGKIFSFEPDPDSFDILSNKKTNNANFYNLALTNQIGIAKFYRNKISHTNSLYKVNFESKDSIRFSQNISNDNEERLLEFNSVIEVPTITLDKFVNDKSISKIDLIKIDVQGAEELVLSGGKNSLTIVSAIIVEVSLYDYYENSTSFIDIEKYLIPAGFELFSILDISRNPMNGRTDWVEALYTKRLA